MEAFIDMEDKISPAFDITVEMNLPLRAQLGINSIIDDKIRRKLSQT